MAIPKKKAEGFSNDADDENLPLKARDSKFDNDDDDIDNLKLDEFDNYDSDNDYDDDDD